MVVIRPEEAERRVRRMLKRVLSFEICPGRPNRRTRRRARSHNRNRSVMPVASGSRTAISVIKRFDGYVPDESASGPDGLAARAPHRYRGQVRIISLPGRTPGGRMQTGNAERHRHEVPRDLDSVSTARSNITTQQISTIACRCVVQHAGAPNHQSAWFARRSRRWSNLRITEQWDRSRAGPFAGVRVEPILSGDARKRITTA